MKLKTIYIPFIFAVIVFGGIFLFDSLGLWQVESSKEPSVIREGEFAGMSDPGDIRGSYSFSDISASFEVTPELLAKAFGISVDNPGDFMCKDLETYYELGSDEMEVGTGSVREFVAIYTNLPYEGDDGFPDTAVAVLKEAGKWSDELEDAYSHRIVVVSDITNLGFTVEADTESESSETKLSETETSEEVEEHDETIGVKGKTTVADIISWGVSKEEIEAVLGVDVANENLLIKDICTQNDLSFSEMKSELNDLLGIE